MSKQEKVVTRMAPSPTGKFHIGGVRTALYNYLFARQHEGEFIIRSEDTDKERSKKEYEDDMLAVFDWLGIGFDAFYRQSERTALYQEHLQKLIDAGHAYYAEGSKENPDIPVIRFKNPEARIRFNDIILGEIVFDTKELGDFVIARSIDTPVYHFTVVVDDGLMDITHVIRGQEHINNTARQILILEALGFTRPLYAHIPLIMSPRGGKLSKRDPEVIPALEYRDHGILKEALINFLAFIGWNPGDEREIMNLQELTDSFDLTKVQKGGGVFNIDKLYWINKQYLQRFSLEEFRLYLDPYKEVFASLEGYSHDILVSILPLIKERIQSFKDLDDMIDGGEIQYFFTDPSIEASALVWKKSDAVAAQKHLKHILDMLKNYADDWNADELKAYLFPYAEQEGKGDVLWPLRYALSGQEKSPDPFTLLEILGWDSAERRIQKAISLL